MSWILDPNYGPYRVLFKCSDGNISVSVFSTATWSMSMGLGSYEDETALQLLAPTLTVKDIQTAFYYASFSASGSTGQEAVTPSPRPATVGLFEVQWLLRKIATTYTPVQSTTSTMSSHIGAMVDHVKEASGHLAEFIEYHTPPSRRQ